MSGKRRRLRRLFRHPDGRAILTPIDHGLWFGPLEGIERPREVARKVIGGSDGLLLAPGFARAIADELPSDRALVIRVGAATALSPVQDYETVFAGVETALRLDADAMIHTLYLGHARDDQALRDLGNLIETAQPYDVPVVAEFLPAGDAPDWPAEQVAHWARLGFEMGADAIKTIYTGQPASFRQVVEGCNLPILVAGGPNVGSLSDLLRTVADAIAAGAAGLAIGRRVWQARDPARLLVALGQLVHNQIGVEEALGSLNSQLEKE